MGQMPIRRIPNMNTTISNDRLSVTVSDFGAQLQSVRLDGIERLWQGDEAIWGERSPVIFPFVGRVKNGKYTFRGKEYPSEGPHGFARRSTFALVDSAEDFLTYRLVASEATKKEYPFDFILDVTYRIKDNTLIQSFTVENTDNEPLYYSCGGHPGFLVPPTDKTVFEDWSLEFAEGETLNQILLDGLFMSRTVAPCKFAKGNVIPLTHAVFDEEAIILTGLKKSMVTLKNNKTAEKVTVDASQFQYLAFWQAMGCDAPYVCVEPWNGLPSDSKDPEDLTVKRDLRILDPQKRETCSVSYTLD